MEQLDLTSPVSVTDYRVRKIVLDWAAAIIKIRVVDTTGDESTHTYTGETATTLMTQLNKIDLSTNSLHKRILDRLVADGKLPAGTVTGTPDLVGGS